MQTIDPVLRRMREAQVQSYAFDQEIGKQRVQTLADVINLRQYEQGIGGYVSYNLTGPASRVCHVAMVFAKELVTRKVQVYVTSLIEIGKAWSLPEGARSSWYDLDNLGKGYLVIPAAQIEQEMMSGDNFAGAIEMLLVHHGRGGGIVFGAIDFKYNPGPAFNGMLGSFTEIPLK